MKVLLGMPTVLRADRHIEEVIDVLDVEGDVATARDKDEFTARGQVDDFAIDREYPKLKF